MIIGPRTSTYAATAVLYKNAVSAGRDDLNTDMQTLQAAATIEDRL